LFERRHAEKPINDKTFSFLEVERSFCMKMTRWIGLVLLVISCLTLFACQNQNETQNLANTSWTLKSLGNANNVTPVLHSGTINITFSNDQKSYSGFDGVNSYSGSCKVKGDTISIVTSTQTLIGTTDQELSKQLATYHDLLQKASSFNITNGELTIKCDDSQILLFTRVTP
jgi:heat shock protein HslJ